LADPLTCHLFSVTSRYSTQPALRILQHHKIQMCGADHAGFNVRPLEDERPPAVSHMDKYCNNFTPAMCFKAAPILHASSRQT
jgi:hypothetical protein